jgi:hypothetical protein
MVLQFYRNVHENQLIRANTPNLDIEALATLCKTNAQTGTRVSAQLMIELSRKIPTLSFTLKTDASLADINRELREGQPCIVMYDCEYLMYKTPGKVGHAGVVLCTDTANIYLNNPWLGAEVEVSMIEFDDAWDLNYKQVVLMAPQYQTLLHDDGTGNITNQQAH